MEDVEHSGAETAGHGHGGHHPTLSHLEELEIRLEELAATGRVKWYPENLLLQLREPNRREALTRIEEVVHRPQTREQAAFPPTFPEDLIDWPVPTLRRIFFYVPNQLVVAPSVRDEVVDGMRRMVDPERQKDDYAEPKVVENVSGYDVLEVDPGERTVPELADGLRRMLGDESESEPLVSPNHVYFGGPMHCGGPGNMPDNKTADGRDLTPIPEPIGDAGHGVVVAVLDSGILPPSELPDWVRKRIVYESHSDIESRYFDVVAGEEFIRYPRVHGTFVTGIVLQVAPGAKVLVKKLLDENGIASDADLGRALNAVLDSPYGPPSIINLSLGCPAWTNSPPPILTRAFQRVLSHTPPIIVVAAAGNGGSDQAFWPAAHPDSRVIGVGAVRPNGQRSEWSNFGPPVKVWALGEEVTSLYATGVFRRERPGPLHRPFAGLACWGGTSFAAPRVAGLIAAAMTERSLPLELAARHVVSVPPAQDTAGTALPAGHGLRPVPLVTDGLVP